MMSGLFTIPVRFWLTREQYVYNSAYNASYDQYTLIVMQELVQRRSGLLEHQYTCQYIAYIYERQAGKGKRAHNARHRFCIRGAAKEQNKGRRQDKCDLYNAA